MLMLVALLLTGAPATGAVLTDQPVRPAQVPAHCRPERPQRIAERDRAGACRLTELPPHRHEMAVMKSVAGCPVALVKEEGRLVHRPATPAQTVPTPAGAPTRTR